MMVRLLLSIVFAGLSAAQGVGGFDNIATQANAARDAGKVDQAVDLYQQALHLKPDWKEGWWVLGSILYDNNRYQECAEAFRPLTVLDSDKSPGWAMTGLCEFEAKSYEQSLVHLRKAAELGLPEALADVMQYHLGLALIELREFDQAMEMMSRSAAQQVENPRMVEAMGLAALRRPMLPSQIAGADHDLVMATGRAICDAAASRGKDATIELERLLAEHPKVAQLHYLYGLVLLQSDSDKAVAAFRQELILSPGHPQTLISLASEFVKRDDYQTALSYAEKAVASDPQYFAAHAMLGKVLVEGNLDSSRGIKELEAAVGMAPRNPQSRLALAAAYARVGRKADAAAQRAEFLQLRTQLDKGAARE